MSYRRRRQRNESNMGERKSEFRQTGRTGYGCGTDKRYHAHAYRRAVLHYQAQLQWEVDLKEPVLDRGCRLSYDPECFYDPDSLPVKMEQPLVLFM